MSQFNCTYSAPKDKAECISLLDEAICIGKDLNKQLDEMTNISGRWFANKKSKEV